MREFRLKEMIGVMTEKARGMATSGTPNAKKAPIKDAAAAATSVTA